MLALSSRIAIWKDYGQDFPMWSPYLQLKQLKGWEVYKTQAGRQTDKEVGRGEEAC